MHVVDVFIWFWLTGWLFVCVVVWIENPSVPQFQHLEGPHGAQGFTCGPSHCINFHSPQTMCNMYSLERHVIQCEHWHTTDLHQPPDSLLCHCRWSFHLYCKKGNMKFLSMLNVKLWVLALPRMLWLGICLLVYTVQKCLYVMHSRSSWGMRKMFSTPKLFYNTTYLFCITS